VNSPLTDPLDDPIDDGDLATWIERAMFDDHTPDVIAAQTQPQTHSHPLHGWRPADSDQAEWAMARLVEIEHELGKIREEHDAWADRVEQSRRNSTRSLTYRARFFTEALRGYALDWHDEYPAERKTLHLPSGVVKCTTPQKPTVQLVPAGRAGLVEWLQALEPAKVDAAKALKVIDPEPMISGVRKLVEARKVGDEWKVIDPDTGEVLPGLRAEPPGPTTAEPKPHLP
jgi:hypothetical protein